MIGKLPIQQQALQLIISIYVFVSSGEVKGYFVTASFLVVYRKLPRPFAEAITQLSHNY